MKWALLAVSLVFGAVGAVVVTGIWLYRPLSGPPASERVIEIRPGASQRTIAAQLEREGMLRSRWQWWLDARLTAGVPAPKAGRHPVSPSMTVTELRRRLGSPPLPEDVSFTVVEGWRVADTDEALHRAGYLPAGAYIEAAGDPSRFSLPFGIEGATLEGYLFPETFRLPPDFGADDLIRRQLDAFVTRFFEPHRTEIDASPRTLSELVIMASILEREEPDPSLRPKVAGVLYKRLDAKVPLGVDATSRYRLEQWNHRTSFLRQLRDPSDPYNTRLKEGFPPTAIGAPGLDSLRAALEPVKSPYWYYLHDADKNIHFAKSAREHEANRKRYNVY